MLIKNKVSIVTGATRGIGREIAIRLAKEGSIVVATGRDKIAIEKVVCEVKNYQRISFGLALDVTNEINIREAISYIKNNLGRIDILVNNAGISHASRIVDMPDDIWDKTMDTNAKGVFRCCRAIGKVMMEQGHGKIINIASVGAKKGLEFYGQYVASKFAVLGLTKTLALELAPYNVQVNAVCPGIVMTDMMNHEIQNEANLRNLTSLELENKYLEMIPCKKFATTDDIAKVVAFLASDYSDYITGESINVTGGEQ